MEIERALTLLVVWALVASSAIQAAVHFVTWSVLHRQYSQTAVGAALNRRELSLGVKAMARTVFDVMLAIVVTWGVLIFNMKIREVLFLLISAAGAVAIWYGLRFVIALRRESFGRSGP